MSLNRIMNMSSQSMANAKTAIATSNHNIANADTKGYSRQRVDLATNVPVVRNGYTMGTGAKVREIKRINDDFIELQIRNDISKKGKSQAEFFGAKQLENLFNEATSKGIGHYLNAFNSSLQRLSENPDQGAIREMVKVSAKDLCHTFNNIYKQIGWIREDVDNRIDGLVTEVNQLAKDIAELNGGIKKFKIMGENANDFIDERNVKLQRLSEIIDVKVTEDNDSNCMVRIANSGNLINNTDVFTLKAPRTAGGLGDKNLILVSPTGGEKDITEQIENGELSGYLNFRHDDIINTLDKVNTLAGTIVVNFNEVHKRGYGLNGEQGINFFSPIETLTDPETGEEVHDFTEASRLMSVSDEVLKRSAAIAASHDPGAVADNRNILDLIELTNTRLLEDGLLTMEDFYNGFVGSVGLKLNRIERDLEHQNGVLTQLDAIRESISGVSLDEETAELMKHQHNFDAAARLINVTDELFDTILNLGA